MLRAPTAGPPSGTSGRHGRGTADRSTRTGDIPESQGQDLARAKPCGFVSRNVGMLFTRVRNLSQNFRSISLSLSLAPAPAHNGSVE